MDTSEQTIDSSKSDTEQVDSTDSIILGERRRNIGDNQPVLVELGRYVVPTAFHSWVNIIFVYRQKHPLSGAMSRIKVSLRKYRYYKSRWRRVSSFNVNSVAEASAVMKILASKFPEAAVDL